MAAVASDTIGFKTHFTNLKGDEIPGEIYCEINKAALPSGYQMTAQALDRVVGTLFCYEDRRAEELFVTELENFTKDEADCLKGVGTALIDGAVMLSCTLGCQGRVSLYSKEKAVGFYAKLGFLFECRSIWQPKYHELKPLLNNLKMKGFLSAKDEDLSDFLWRTVDKVRSIASKELHTPSEKVTNSDLRQWINDMETKGSEPRINRNAKIIEILRSKVKDFSVLTDGSMTLTDEGIARAMGRFDCYERIEPMKTKGSP
ncbi:MAG: GNAT family N-acetyltransferase [Simkaniaceae bacterium]|nr:GNAT family N-acetyltransferase [Simkaniaceae bacterium]